MARTKKTTKKKPSAKTEEVAITERRYFELGDKFFEIWLEGPTSLRTRFGKIGSPGQTKIKDFEAYYEATREFRRVLDAKTKEGYAQTVAGAAKTVAKTNAALEKAIVANPYDDAAYLVYADWLQGEGDPRGELIALQASGKKAAAKKLLDKHVDTFLGTLKDHQICYDGFHDNKQHAFTWKNGFIYAARLAHNQHATEWKGRLATDVLEPLLSHPSGRFLVELTINENDDPTEGSIEDLVEVLARKAPPTLRKIRIGDDISQLSWYRPGDLSKLWKAVPHLTHFDIEAGEFELGTMDLPELVHAVFYTGGLSKSAAKSIAKARWPKIEHLEVYYGDSTYGGDTTIKDVMPLLDRTDMPKLKYLGVKDAEYQDQIVEAVAKSKLLKQLDVLDLSCGIMTDAAIETFLSHKKAFEHLKVLDVSTTYLTKEGAKKLKGIAKSVKTDDVRGGDQYDTDPEWRYVWVGE